MKIDLSSILVVIAMVIPGLFAQRGRNLIVPAALTAKGATEEFAEFVAFGLITQAVLMLCFALGSVVASLVTEHCALFFLSLLDSATLVEWSGQHRAEVVLLASIYVLFSFFIGHCLGLLYGIASDRGGSVTALIDSRLNLASRLGVRGLIGKRPIISEVLYRRPPEKDCTYNFFVEAHLKDQQGIYSGQVEQFAILKDEEQHKPIYLIDPFFKQLPEDEYTPVAADGILLDLAEVSVLYVRHELDSGTVA